MDSWLLLGEHSRAGRHQWPQLLIFHSVSTTSPPQTWIRASQAHTVPAEDFHKGK